METGQALAGRFADAVAHAAEAHRHQVRKGTDTPYLAHLLSVAALVIEFGGTESQATAGVLHDVVEDQGGLERLDDVRQRFGDEIADMVAELSDAVPAAGEAKAPWRERKEAYLEDLQAKVAEGSPAVLVSACDKLHNAEAIVADATDPTGNPGLDVFSRFRGSTDGAAWYYQALLATFRETDLPPRLLDRLAAAITELTAAAERAQRR